MFHITRLVLAQFIRIRVKFLMSRAIAIYKVGKVYQSMCCVFFLGRLDLEGWLIFRMRTKVV